MKNILITGGAGYIGSNLVNKLIKIKGYQIFVIDNLSTGKRDFINDKATFYNINLQNKKKLETFFFKNKIDLIIHLAASISVEESEKKNSKYKKNNIIATSNLISLSKKYSVKNFFFSSTAAVYGNIRGISKYKENLICKPVNYYGKTKLVSEKEIIKKFSKPIENYVILRFFNVLGSSLNYKTGPIPTFSNHLVKNICSSIIKKTFQVKIFGSDYKTRDGTCIRDYIHVEDLTDIIMLISKKILLKEKKIKKILNCGYGYGFSVKEIVKEFEKLLKRKLKISFEKRRKGDPAIVVCSNYKIKKVLNWKPKHNRIRFILKNSLTWFRKYYSINAS